MRVPFRSIMTRRGRGWGEGKGGWGWWGGGGGGGGGGGVGLGGGRDAAGRAAGGLSGVVALVGAGRGLLGLGVGSGWGLDLGCWPLAVGSGGRACRRSGRLVVGV